MKNKNLKNISFVLAFLLSQSTLAAALPGVSTNSAQMSSTAIIEAIDKFHQAAIKATGTGANDNTSLMSATVQLNKTLTAAFAGTNSTAPIIRSEISRGIEKAFKDSVLVCPDPKDSTNNSNTLCFIKHKTAEEFNDKKVENKFDYKYVVSTNPQDPNKSTKSLKEEPEKKPKDTTASQVWLNNDISNLFTIAGLVNEGMSDLIEQKLDYAIQKNAKDIVYDKISLLLQPVENGANNINAKNFKDLTVLGQLLKSSDLEKYQKVQYALQYLGWDGVEKKKPEQQKNLFGFGGDQQTSEKKPEIDTNVLSIDSLTGPDSYVKDSLEMKKAQLFINEMMQATPPPKTIYIPEKNEAKDNKVEVILPVANTNEGTPYTIVKISTARDNNDSSEYDKMLKFIQEKTLYQEYKIMCRSLYAIQTLFLDPILRSFQERAKSTNNEKSLVEKEKDMALVGLTQKYYKDLQDKSPTELNVEALYTLNKIVYFLHKIHQDNQRIQLLIAASGLHLHAMNPKVEKDHINPLSTYINLRCWDRSAKNSKNQKQCESVGVSPEQTAAKITNG